MKSISKILSVLLAFCLFLNIAVFSVGAKVTVDGNTWYGDEVKVDVVAGTEGYNYMSLFRKPISGYEFSGHFIGGTESPQTFVVIDTAKYDGTSWTPDGTYELGESNYDVMYCCDVETMIKDGAYYKKINLDESEYYTPEQAKKIRAIVSNAYPYVSLEEMKANLKENGFQYADEMKRGELISAIQAAIWITANSKAEDDMKYDRSYRVTDNFQWGQPVHDISDEAGYTVSGKRVFETYEDVRVRHDALVDYLLALQGTDAKDDQIVITKLDIVNYKIKSDDGLYSVTLNVKLNRGADADDNVEINAYIGGESVASVKVTDTDEYALKLDASKNNDVKVVVSGVQNLERGVYFYAPKPEDVDGDGVATSREVSQNLVGVSMGETPVYAESEISLKDIAPIEPVSVKIDGLKYLDGKLASGFTFHMKDSEGNIVRTATSNEDGAFTFDAIEFSDEGVYTFTVSEAIGDGEMNKYDDKIYDIKVIVSYEKSVLKLEVSGAEKIEFFNETLSPEEESSTVSGGGIDDLSNSTGINQSPKPGDGSNLVIMLVLAAVSLSVACVIVSKKKKTQF